MLEASFIPKLDLHPRQWLFPARDAIITRDGSRLIMLGLRLATQPTVPFAKVAKRKLARPSRTFGAMLPCSLDLIARRSIAVIDVPQCCDIKLVFWATEGCILYEQGTYLTSETYLGSLMLSQCPESAPLFANMMLWGCDPLRNTIPSWSVSSQHCRDLVFQATKFCESPSLRGRGLCGGGTG